MAKSRVSKIGCPRAIHCRPTPNPRRSFYLVAWQEKQLEWNLVPTVEICDGRHCVDPGESRGGELTSRLAKPREKEMTGCPLRVRHQGHFLQSEHSPARLRFGKTVERLFAHLKMVKMEERRKRRWSTLRQLLPSTRVCIGPANRNSEDLSSQPVRRLKI